MDTNALVDFEINAGQRLVVQLVRDGFKVVAAFWIRTPEEGVWWSLYIASPIVEEKGPASAYRTLQVSLQKLQGIPLSLSDVKLIGATDPITADVLAALNRHAYRLPTRYGGKQLGGMLIEDAYLYPTYLFTDQAPGRMTEEELFLELFRLFNRRPGPRPPSRVTLQDGSTLEGTPLSIQSGGDRPPIVQFMTEDGCAPLQLSIDEIASIQ